MRGWFTCYALWRVWNNARLWICTQCPGGGQIFWNSGTGVAYAFRRTRVQAYLAQLLRNTIQYQCNILWKMHFRRFRSFINACVINCTFAIRSYEKNILSVAELALPQAIEGRVNASTCSLDDTTRKKQQRRLWMCSWSDVFIEDWVLSSAIVVSILFLSSFWSKVFVVPHSFTILALLFFYFTIAAVLLS